MATSVPVTNPTSATPILDLRQPLPRRKRWKLWAGWTLWIAAVVIVTQAPDLAQRSGFWGVTFHILDLLNKTFAGTMTGPATPVSGELWLGPLFMFAYVYLIVIIHELGHLFAGLAVRFRANFIIFYPFRFTRTRTGWSIQRERLLSASGAASMLPNDLEHLRGRLLIFVLGGPAANLLTFLLLRMLLPRVQQAPNTFVWYLDFFANMSLLIGAVNLLPFQAKGFQSDGARVVMTLAQEKKFLRWFALIRLGTAMMNGIRARDLDPGLIGQALELQDRSGDTMRANLIAYSWAAGRDDVAAAAGYLEKCLACAGRLPTRTRNFLLLEAIVFQGWYREDAARALEWFNRAGAARKRFPVLYRLRPEIAVAWAQGHSDEALAKLREAIAAIGKMPANSSRDLLEASMTEWQEKMRQRLEARPVNTIAQT